jgi:hypothetical protein
MRLTRILDPIRNVDTRTKVNDGASLATTSSPSARYRLGQPTFSTIS